MYTTLLRKGQVKASTKCLAEAVVTIKKRKVVLSTWKMPKLKKILKQFTPVFVEEKLPFCPSSVKNRRTAKLMDK